MRRQARTGRRQPALRGEGCNAFFVRNDDRVIAFQRWVVGVGRDIVMVASLNEVTHFGYRLPFPVGGNWVEVFNSEAYDNRPACGGYNTSAVGNPGGVSSDGPPPRDCRFRQFSTFLQTEL